MPHGRQVTATAVVRIHRSRREIHRIMVDFLPTVPLARATLDAALTLVSDDAALGLVNALVNGGHATPDQLGRELLLASARGSGPLRRALQEMGHGTRSTAEASARALFRDGGLPEPEINVPIRVGDKTYLADFRWGRFIVEIDSREHHLLGPGSYEATQARRAALQAAGYFVLTITPTMLAKDPEGVLAAVREGYRQFCG